MSSRPLTVAEEVVRKAADMIEEALPDRRKGVQTKGEHASNLVTELDHRSEQLITSRLKTAFPDHDWITEEGKNNDTGAAYRWLIDPLDGTSNFAHGFPVFAVTVAFQERNGSGENPYETLLGVTRIPWTDETFRARKGEGAYRNNEEVSVSDREPLSRAMVATGFPYDKHESDRPLFQQFEEMVRNSRSIRRAGAAAVDLCYVACGIFDGFWEWDLAPWDTAAGALMVREAGGNVTDFSGEPHDPSGTQTLASNGNVHGQMQKILADIEE